MMLNGTCMPSCIGHKTATDQLEVPVRSPGRAPQIFSGPPSALAVLSNAFFRTIKAQALLASFAANGLGQLSGSPKGATRTAQILLLHAARSGRAQTTPQKIYYALRVE